MIVGAPPLGPVEFSVANVDRQVIDAGKTLRHQPIGIEIPVFVAIGPKPVATVVMPFVGIADANSAVSERPQLFY